jgi:hypothetical protein
MKDKEDEQNKGEVTPARDEADSLKKRTVSPLKPSSQKKSKSTVTKMLTTFTPDDFDFIIEALNDTSLEIMEKQEAKREEMYDSLIEVKLRGVQQALHFIPVALGDELAQLHQLADATEDHLRRSQEETQQATQDLKQVQGVLV